MTRALHLNESSGLVPSAIVSAGLSITGSGAAYVANILVSRVLGIHQFGEYSFILSLATLLAVPGSFGFSSAYVRLGPRYAGKGDGDKWLGLLASSTTVTLASSIGLATAFWLIAGLTSISVPAGSGRLAVLLVPALALMDLSLGILRASGHVASALAPKLLVRHIGLVLVVLALLATHRTISSNGLLTAYAIICLGLIGLQLRVLWPHIKTRLRANSRPTFLNREWLAVSLPFLATTLAFLAIDRVGVIFIGFAGLQDQTAVFYAATRLAALIGLPLGALAVIASPKISEAYGRGEAGVLQRLAAVTGVLGFVPATLLIVAVAVFAGPLLSLFGPGYAAGTPVLRILLAGQLANAAAGMAGGFLSMTAYEVVSMRTVTISAVLCLVLNAILVPPLGAIGAAIAAAGTMLTWNAALVVTCIRRLGINPTAFQPKLLTLEAEDPR